MTTEDAMPVVAWSLAWPRDVRLNRVNANTTYGDEAGANEYAALCMEPDQIDPRPDLIQVVPLVRQSDALAALTLVQAERDAAREEEERWRKQAAQRTTDAMLFADQRDAMQQERDELRAALESIALAGMSGCGMESAEGMRAWHARRAWEFIAIAAAALAPKAAQPTSERGESPDLGINGSRCGTHGTSGS